MKNKSGDTFQSLIIFFLFVASVCNAQTENLSRYINPLNGTSGIIAYGRTTPFVTPPFGMTHWTACTRSSWLGAPNYQYLTTRIRGFRGTHKPALWMGDYGYVTLIPNTGKMKACKIEQKSFYSHGAEVSKPEYYSVKLHTVNLHTIKVEMTATSRCAMFQFHFGKNARPDILIEASQSTKYSEIVPLLSGQLIYKPDTTLPDFDGWIHIDTAKREITGWNTDRHSWKLGPSLPNFKGYFVIQFDEPFESWGTWKDDSLNHNNTQQQANACGSWITFNKGTSTIHAKVGTSFISLEQAHENLQKEIGSKDFATIQQQTQDEWNQYLNRIALEGATKRQRAIFYTCAYHCMLFPRVFSEYGRYYSAFDDKIHNGISYNDYSLWDTYRAEHPLLILLTPERVPGMVQSLLQMYQEGGYMPKWPNPTYTSIMIGTHADAVVADAVVKGIKGIDISLAHKACMKDAMEPPVGDSLKRWADRAPWSGYEARAGLSWYKKLGYVPVDKTNESVANTLEGAYDDFCVAQVAKAAKATDDYNVLMQRSRNYINVYDSTTGFMAPRLSTGPWGPDPDAGFTEGSKWTYLFCVQHDIPGLITLMGKDRFVQQLNKNFKALHYVHENEPGHHYCYLFDYVGMSWRTQQLVAHFRAIKYLKGPFSSLGDDDCGQMSAWYIFSALGFYPVTPGTDVYAIGTPLFPKATLYPDPNDKSKKLEIVANHVSKRNIYVQSITLNGVKLREPFLHHADIEKGGQLVFEMGSKKLK